MKSTPKIIELARKLYATGYRQEIEIGIWVTCDAGTGMVVQIFKDDGSGHGDSADVRVSQVSYYEELLNGFIPIPSLSTCLAFLRKWAVKHHLELPDLIADDEHGWTCQWGASGIHDWTYATMPKEAAMLAMLKILEGENE